MLRSESPRVPRPKADGARAHLEAPRAPRPRADGARAHFHPLRNRSTLASAIDRIPEPVLTAGFLAALVILAYGPFLTQFGFYRDDWYVLWAGRALGPGSVITMFSVDRPVVGWLYSLTYTIFRDHALLWQVYSLILRYVGGLALLYALRRVWPKMVLPTTAAVGLMLLYPGFLQQPNAMTFSNQLLGHAAGLLSIAWSLAALDAGSRRGRWLLTAGALATGLLCMLVYEYMIGLEGLRFLLLAARLRRTADAPPRSGLGPLHRVWLPYGLVIGANLAWRALFFQSIRQATNVQGLLAGYAADPLRSGFQLIAQSVVDLWDALVAGWAVPAYQFLSSSEAGPLFVSMALGLLVIALGAVYLTGLRTRGRRDFPTDASGGRSANSMFVLGLVATLLGIVPVVAALRDVRWDSGFDRYTLHLTAGLGLATAGFLWAWVGRRARLPILGFLLALSVLSHYQNGLHWKDFWEAERQIWWQLSWRAPQIQPGTVLLVDPPIDGFLEDYESWAPANLIYYPDSHTPVVTSEVFSDRVLEKLQFGGRDSRGMRALISFPRDYTHALVLTLPNLGTCLHILDSRRLELPPDAEDLVRISARYSRIDQILTEAAPHLPPSPTFLPEPARGWCFYYQQASLARQRGDWAAILRLGSEVTAMRLHPSDRSEWLPFLEGYVYAGDLEQARRIATLIQDRESIRHALCDMLVGHPLSGTTQAQLDTLMGILCP